MTSLPLADIIIDRPARQRRILVSLEELADSIARTGLIHPPVVTRERVLVAGERRIEAMRSLGWAATPVTYTDELDPNILRLIELEENIARAGLPWQDEAKAIFDYHTARAAGEASWSEAGTARALGRSEKNTRSFLDLARAIASGNALVRDAQNKTVALNMIERLRERARASAYSGLAPKPKEPSDVQKPATRIPASDGAAPQEPIRKAALPVSPILCTDFAEFASTYTGPPFNFFHCDFPYGVNADKRQQGTSVYKHGGYADSPDVYWNLLGVLAENIEALASPSAHMMFWFSMDYYTETLGFFARELPDWTFQPFPLYWSKSDNVGLLPDPKRGPRRVVETAFIGSRGDRLVVQSVANHVSLPTERRAGHISVKPEVMLRHFFRMFVDEHTTMLDPTCGLGSSLRAARASGASRVCGVERDPGFAEIAQRLWRGEEIEE